MVDYADMGKRIKMIRRKKRLSQKELGKMVNISPSYFGNIERGLRVPSIDTLVAIANALEVGTDFLLGESLTAVQSISKDELKKLTRFLRDRVAELEYDSDAADEYEDDEEDGIIYDEDQ